MQNIDPLLHRHYEHVHKFPKCDASSFQNIFVISSYHRKALQQVCFIFCVVNLVKCFSLIFFLWFNHVIVVNLVKWVRMQVNILWCDRSEPITLHLLEAIMPKRIWCTFWTLHVSKSSSLGPTSGSLGSHELYWRSLWNI
jgi:hypothetical protein